MEDLRQTPPAPAFFNLETHRLQPFVFRRSYAGFIDVVWDASGGRVFFSAKATAAEPYRVYVKPWPDGEETPIYENPLGPFRFLLSPGGDRLALQVMGPAAWPILAVHDWRTGHTTALGEGYSPDWSPDGKRLLFLHIPGSLPTWLSEYEVATDTVTPVLKEPVAEAIYGADPDVILLKTEAGAKKCDVVQAWNRKREKMEPFSLPSTPKRGPCVTQREISAFPGHQMLFFKESPSATDMEHQTLVITNESGGRLQTIDREDWDPKATAVESITLAIGEDPLFVMSADGTGDRLEVPHVRFIRPSQTAKK